MNTLPLYFALIDALRDSGDRMATHLVGTLLARFVSIRTMSLAIASELSRAPMPDLATEAGLVKDIGTHFEREITEAVNGENLAHEARDEVGLSAELSGDAVGIDARLTADRAWQRGALMRAVLMSGAFDGILELTIAYTRQRAQFGRNLIQF
jgi:hypothetical protein